MSFGERCWVGFSITNYANLANGTNTLSVRNNLQSIGKCGEKVTALVLMLRRDSF